jgi:hypothetical protein
MSTSARTLTLISDTFANTLALVKYRFDAASETFAVVNPAKVAVNPDKMLSVFAVMIPFAVSYNIPVPADIAARVLVLLKYKLPDVYITLAV